MNKTSINTITNPKKKILITSALPYVNNVPHLGNIVGSVLSADVYARFCRLKGLETLYICGSDEHGTATETKAREAKVSPRELCDKYYEIHKSIYEWFNISFDIFGRTSKENHHKITQELFNKVLENGYVEEKTVTQPYCPVCQAFLADRFIEGECPHCHYEDARGDQCDKCGKLLTPKELINPRCKVDGTTPEFKETDHLFIRLDKLQPSLEKWFEKVSAEGKWTENAIRTTKAWFKEGLQPRAITRDLKWGINIPETAFNGKYKDKVFYVWFDAPIGYISITEQLLGDKWKDWWMNPKETELVQFMGKDNIPFHSIIFPGTLLAANKNKEAITKENVDEEEFDYTLVTHLDVTEYLNYEHTKFSKSRNIGVFGDNAQESGIPADVFRYMLMYNRPENADTQFTWKGVQERLNNELVANFGNFVNRTLSFTERFLDGKLEALAEGDLSTEAKRFYETYSEEVKHFINLMENVKLREALQQFLKISSLGNVYFQENEPWKTKNTNRNKCEHDIALLTNVVKDLAILIEPFMPTTSTKIFEQLNINKEERKLSNVLTLSAKPRTINKVEILFKKLDDKEVKELQGKYGSNDDEKKENKENKKNGTENKGDKKNKSNNKNKEKKKETKPVEPLSASDIDLRVGEIIDVKKHPDAEKLYIETVDFGNGEHVEIVSGLVPYYTEEELLHKKIIVVKNLAPAKLRGVKSHGMLLAAEDEKGTVGLLLAPNAPLGSRVLAGMDAPAKEQITFPEFLTLKFGVEEGKVYLNDGEMIVENESIVVDRNIRKGNVN